MAIPRLRAPGPFYVDRDGAIFEAGDDPDADAEQIAAPTFAFCDQHVVATGCATATAICAAMYREGSPCPDERLHVPRCLGERRRGVGDRP